MYAVEMLRDGVRSVEPISDAEPLTDGDVLPVPGEPRVLFAPGHTPGSCALFVEDRDILFGGDVLATRNIFTQQEGAPQLLGDADEDHEEAKASLARLEGLGSVTLLPGHWNPWRGEIDKAVALARYPGLSLASVPSDATNGFGRFAPCVRHVGECGEVGDVEVNTDGLLIRSFSNPDLGFADEVQSPLVLSPLAVTWLHGQNTERDRLDDSTHGSRADCRS